MTFRPAALAGYELLGKTVLTVAAATTSIITIPARDMLLIQYRVTGYSGADIAAFRFGGTAGSVDTAANYWDRHLTSARGATTFTNTQTASSTMLRVAASTSTRQRTGLVTVTNLQGVSKLCGYLTGALTSTGAAATVGGLDIGGGEWINTTQQIVSVQMLDAGANNLNIGTGFAVFGMNLS